MSYIPGDIYYKQFITTNISGVSQNADVLPWGVLNKNGVDDTSVPAKVFVSNIDIGRYNISGVIPSTYAAGNSINLTVSGIINSYTNKAIFDLGVLDSKRLANLVSLAVTGTAPINFIVPNSIAPGVTVSVTGSVSAIISSPVSVSGGTINNIINPVTVSNINPGVTVSVTGTVQANVVSPVSVSGGTINHLIDTVNLSAPAPNNFIVPASVAPGVTVSVTGNIPTSISGPVSVSGGSINHVIDPVSITGTNTFSSTDINQLRYKIGIDGTSSAPTNLYNGHLELSNSGVHNILVENNINMNQWMSLIGAVIAGSSVVNGNNINYYAVNNNGTLKLQSTAISGNRSSIVIYI